MTTTARAAPVFVQTYWRASRAARYALLFAFPLFVFYQLLVLMQPLSPQGIWRNGADVLLQRLFTAVAGTRGPLLFLITLNAVGVWLFLRDRKHNPEPLQARFFAIMLLESTVFALLLGITVGTLTTSLVRPPALAAVMPDGVGLTTKLMLAIGAGLYEEILFRVLLVGALALFARKVLKWKPAVAAGFAVVLGALAFSAFHYIGPAADRLELYSFVFRTFGGLFFSAMFVLRGFGITAWTHALYDIMVMVVQA
jgi:hypothetical protein